MGARVDVVAPSSGFDEASFADGLQVLRDFGLVPILGEHVRDRAGYLAGEDALRTADLRHALLRKDTQAVFCARGGYGLTRLLPALLRDTEVLGALGDKLLVGFSDVTALHALCLRQGAASLHGPVVTSLRRVGDASRELLRRLLFEPRGLGVITPETAVRIAGGRARGLVVGGNLSVLTRLIGTAVWPSLEGRILLLEDVGERPYRLDRMLTHLLLAGAFDRVAGVLLGDFTRCDEPGARPGDPTAADVLRERLGTLGVPVLGGFPTGHGDECFPLLLGTHVLVDADEGRVELEEGLRAR